MTEDTPRRKTPTERQHEALIAALSRAPVQSSQTVEVGRDSRGYRYNVAGVVGQAENLDECAERVLRVCGVMDDSLDWSQVPEVEISRNAKGDHQFTVTGKPAASFLQAKQLEDDLPLSRKQAFDREAPDGFAATLAANKRGAK